jgi:hypothetical protein
MPCFQGKTTPFQYVPSLFGLTRFNPLTEDFTEGFSLVPAKRPSDSSVIMALQS